MTVYHFIYIFIYIFYYYGAKGVIQNISFYNLIISDCLNTTIALWFECKTWSSPFLKNLYHAVISVPVVTVSVRHIIVAFSMPEGLSMRQYSVFYNLTSAGGDYVTVRTRRPNEHAQTCTWTRGNMGDDTRKKMRTNDMKDAKRRGVKRQVDVRRQSGRWIERRGEGKRWKKSRTFKLRTEQVMEEEEEVLAGINIDLMNERKWSRIIEKVSEIARWGSKHESERL